MKVVTLDFETFYDTKSGYSLKKMSTEDYVCDPRFEVVSVAAQIDDEEPQWMTGPHEAVAQWLAKLDLPNSVVCAHHMMFDGLVLAVRFNLFPAFYVCTEAMVRPFLKPLLRSLSLSSVGRHLGLEEKGDEVVRADGKRREDFSPEEMQRYGGVYGTTDVRICRGIYKWARPQLTPTELRLIDMTERMYTQPQLRLDAGVYSRGLRDVQERKAKILAEMEVQGITAAALRSNQQFAELLHARGIDPPMKVSPTSLKKGEVPPKMTFAFSKNDPAFISLREEYAEDLEVTTLINARLSEKSSLEETRNGTLLQIAQRYGWFRVPLAYYAAHTGRYGGVGKSNPLNFPKPKRFELGHDGKPKLVMSQIRRGVIAPPGHMVLAADFAQIEARILATLAGQRDLVRQFATGECVYSDCASGLFGKEVSRESAAVDPQVKRLRDTGKAIILGSGFGMGPQKFKDSVRKDGLILDDLEAMEYINYYRARYAHIPQLWNTYETAIKDLVIAHQPTQVGPVHFEWQDEEARTARVRGPNGLSLLYPRLRMKKGEDERWAVVCNQARDKYPRKLWGGTITENIMQWLARNVIADAMIGLHKELGLRTALQVYDEVVTVVPADRVEGYAAAIVPIMTRAPSWLPGLPIAVDVSYGPSYGDC